MPSCPGEETPQYLCALCVSAVQKQMSLNPLLEIEGLTVRFGERAAVDEVGFSIRRGETFVLLGESGSGKSVTALSVMRLLPQAARVTGGSIRLEGSDLLRLPERAMRDLRGSRIGMIFQEPQTSLNPVLTIGEQIAESLRRHKGLSGREAREQVGELLDSVGIPDPVRRYGEYPHQFSGGMKQRVMIAMALAGDPDLLIADEPTTALDVTIQAQVLDLLQKLQDEREMAMLFITHDLGVAERMADRVAVMYGGKVVEQRGREEFFREPEHPYSRRLFSLIPSRTKRMLLEKEGRVPEPGDQTLLEVRGLKVWFPIRRGLLRRVVDHVRAVDGVSLAIREGETLALVGESGSGKSTLGKGILQLLRPDEGEVRFRGEDLIHLSPREMRRRRCAIQVVFQDPYSSMNPRMMVADIIEEGMLAQGIGASRAQRLARVDELLGQVGLEPEMKFRYPHEFSGGQRQRICIARALAVNPRLIVCDEPTSALDVSVQAQILDLLRELQRKLKLSYLFITHNLAVVEYLAHRVAVMYRGRIVEQGDVDEVLLNPSQEYTRRLLEAVPRVEPPPSLLEA